MQYVSWYGLLLAVVSFASADNRGRHLKADQADHTILHQAQVVHADASTLLFYATTREDAQQPLLALKADGITVLPFLQPLITYHGTRSLSNPLLSQTIEQVASSKSGILFLTTVEEPGVVYALSQSLGVQELTSLALYDAKNEKAGQIVRIEAYDNRVFAIIKSADDSYSLAAASYRATTKQVPLTQEEIAELTERVKTMSEEQKKSLEKEYAQDEKGGYVKNQTIREFVQITACANGAQIAPAYPITRASTCITTKPLESLAEAFVLHWSPSLERLYIGCTLTTGADEQSQACPLMVAALMGDQSLELHPCLNRSLINPNSACSVQGAHKKIAIKDIKTLFTTTFLDYLIVQSSSPDSAPCINALPLVNYITDKGTIENDKLAEHGTLAHKHSSCLKGFSNSLPSQRFLGRHFSDTVRAAQDLCTMQESNYLVGNGPFTAGAIVKMMVQDDAVVILAHAPDGSSALYHSQAIFSQEGPIACWTSWKKIYDSCSRIDDAFFNSKLLQWTFVTPGADFTDVYRTQWQSSSPLNACLEQYLPKDKGGIVAAVENSYLTSTQPEPNSLLCLVGRSTVVLVPSKSDDDDSLLTSGRRWGLQEDHLLSKEPLVIEDPILHAIGSLTTAQIITDDTQAWLMVGGLKGVAILAHEDGRGWSLQSNTIEKGMRFKMWKEFGMMKKIVSDEENVYLLTSSALYKIPLAAASWNQTSLPAHCCAHASAMPDAHTFSTFIDLVVAKKLALLAHSNGLFRNGNGTDIAASTNCKDYAWTRVALYGACNTLVSLTPVLKSDTQELKGQVYVLSGQPGANIGYLQRVALSSSCDHDINEASVSVLEDIFSAKSSARDWVSFREFRNNFATDGTVFLSAAPKSGKKQPRIVTGFNSNAFVLQLPIQNALITGMMYSTVLQGWIVVGDFGLLITA